MVEPSLPFDYHVLVTFFFLISKKIILKKLKRAKTTQRIQRGEQKERRKKRKTENKDIKKPAKTNHKEEN